MNIELRRISYSKRLSRETAAFAADIYVDGVKRGTVENDGGGGMHVLHPYDLEKEIADYARTLPDLKTRYGVLKMTGELFIGELLEKCLAEKDMVRAMKTKTLFTRKGSSAVFFVKGRSPRRTPTRS